MDQIGGFPPISLLAVYHPWSIAGPMRLTVKNAGLFGQATIAVAALLTVAFAPPAFGRMLIIPVGGQSLDQRLFREADAAPLIPGPLPGSWIVEGQRARLARSLASHGVIILAAPQSICADRTTGAETV